MFLAHLFIVSALLVVDVRSDCDDYIYCFTEFLQEFFGNKSETENALNIENVTAKYIELDDKGVDIDDILSDVVDLINQYAKTVDESEVVKETSDETKIHVKTFELDNNKQIFVAEETTENILNKPTTDTISFTNIFMEHPTTTSINNNYSVIPLKTIEENEIFDIDDLIYDIDGDNSTDYPIIDYIDLYKDTTNEDVGYKVTVLPFANKVNGLVEDIKGKEKDIDNIIEHNDVLSDLIENVLNNTIRTCNGDKPNLSSSVFPWIATIFVKHDSKTGQFEYFCDGALLSDRVVLTTARCVSNLNGTIDHENLIVIMGKTSLQVSGTNEHISRVKAVRSHENFSFSDDEAKNDLAVLVLEEAVKLNDGINVACFNPDDETVQDNGEAITTAWSLSGDLMLIYFDKEKSKACGSDNKVENTFCATYGNDVALCPSYGGIYVGESFDNNLYLQGLRHGNPLDRGICFTKDVTYTSLKPYRRWIEEHVKGNK